MDSWAPSSILMGPCYAWFRSERADQPERASAFSSGWIDCRELGRSLRCAISTSASIRWQIFAKLEAGERRGEMALENAPPLLLSLRDGTPHHDPVGAALLDVHDEHGAISPRPLRARLGRRSPKVRITRSQRPTNLGSDFGRDQRCLHRAPAKCRGAEHYERQQNLSFHCRSLGVQQALGKAHFSGGAQPPLWCPLSTEAV